MTYRSIGKVATERAERWDRAAASKDRPFTSWSKRALDSAADEDLKDEKKKEVKP